MQASPRHFGTTRLAQNLSQRIERSFAAVNDSEPALVVGVFGEWGAGKSTLLHHVEEHFKSALEAWIADQAATAMTVPVWFNAWQYEREPHLVIPLLKTARIAIEQVRAKTKTSDDKYRETLERRAELLADLTIAAAQSLDVKLSIAGVGSIALDAPLKWYEKFLGRREARQQARRSPIDKLESMQYDFKTHLESLTGRGKSGPAGDASAALQLNLVFFIDDLDRCLPDKAVEMLEAIKLFLEVPGCAFMLAVDDEVVERGIAHRYRDYLFEAAQARPATERAIAAPSVPITGAEYLEKIVQLPVRLARPTKREVERFLLESHGPLFGLPAEASATPRTAAALAPESAQLLNLMLDVVPPVPRKLVRTVELLQTYRDLLGERRVAVDLRLLFVLVVLQLFAPELYRFLRRRGAFLLRDLAAWSTEGQLHDLELLSRDTARALRRAEENRPRYESQAQLPALLRRLQDNRAGFDLRELLAGIERLWPLAQSTQVWSDLQVYFELGASRDLDMAEPTGPAAAASRPQAPETGPPVPSAAPGASAAPAATPAAAPPAAPAAATPAPGPTSTPAPTPTPDAADAGTVPAAPTRWVDPATAAATSRKLLEALLEPARLENPRDFFEGLAALDVLAWEDALAREAPALQGKQLSDEDFAQLLARLRNTTRRGGGVRDWVRFAELLGPHLDGEQSRQLAAAAWPELAEPIAPPPRAAPLRK